FHWELDFASVFGRGGFDLQVGNPPWVRPDWDEKATFAEFDPWWQLAEKPTQKAIGVKKSQALADPEHQEFMCYQAVAIAGLRDSISDQINYPVIAGLRPDLYRVFMERVWRSTSVRGTPLFYTLSRTSPRRRRPYFVQRLIGGCDGTGSFINELSLFEIHHLVSYGVHVYGPRREAPSFKMAASLYHPDTVARSLVHDGSGEVPGLKDDEGNWDQRPHRERIIDVDETVLAVWADILDEPGASPIQARMVYPVNRVSSRVAREAQQGSAGSRPRAASTQAVGQ
ncbi:restriction endonuclease subunit M, partial [Methylobacterium radiotolerans]